MKSLIQVVAAVVAVALSTDGVSAAIPTQDSCIITGTFTGERSKHIIVFKAGENPLNERMEIPLVGNRFEFKLDKRHPEAYMMVPAENFLGEDPMRPLVFFAEDHVNITLHPFIQSDENSVSGGPLNHEYQQFLKSLRSIYLEPSNALWAAVDAGELDLAEAEVRDSLLEVEVREWQADYISSHPTLVSYYLIKGMMISEDEHDLAQLSRHYPSFAKHFPNHPYTKTVGAFVHAREQLRERKRFIDFQAEDMDGNTRYARELLAEKATLINLWSSWCGPCIANSRTMIPVYEQYKDKGFDIINVATEFKNTEALSGLLDRENLPWTTNLVDIGGKYGVWQTYGMNNEAGMMVLVDGQENVLAINPTAEEVTEILAQLD